MIETKDEIEIEEPFFDENGTEIKEFAVIRVFHFIGSRRKKHYMYKWIRLIQKQDKKFWAAMHLTNASDSSYWLRAVCNPTNRRLEGSVIVQQY